MDKRKRGFRGNIPLLIVEVCVLCVSIGFMYVVITMTEEVNHKAIDEERIYINEEVVREKKTGVIKAEAKA